MNSHVFFSGCFFSRECPDAYGADIVVTCNVKVGALPMRVRGSGYHVALVATIF